MELWLNRSEMRYRHDTSIADPEQHAKSYPELRVGAFWIPIEMPQKEIVGTKEDIFNNEKLAWNEIRDGRRYEIWRLLKRFRSNYRMAGFQNDGVWKLLSQHDDYNFPESGEAKKLGALTGVQNGRDFKVVDTDAKSVSVEKLNGGKQEITLMLSNEWKDNVTGAISNMADEKNCIRGFRAESLRVILSYQPFEKK